MKYVRKKIYRMMAAVMLLAVLVQSDPDGGIDRHGTV